MLLKVFCLFVSFLLQGKLQRFLYNLPKEMIKRLHRFDFTKIITYMCNKYCRNWLKSVASSKLPWKFVKCVVYPVFYQQNN